MLHLYFTAVSLLFGCCKVRKDYRYIQAKIEPFLHAMPLLAATSFAIFRLASNSLNPQLSGICTGLLYSPPYCANEEVGFVIEGLFKIPCGRGASYATGLKLLGYLMLVILFCPPIIMITSLTLIYRTVKKIENKANKYGASAFCTNIQSRTSTECTTTSGPINGDTKGCWQSVKQSIKSSPIMKSLVSSRDMNLLSISQKEEIYY